MAKLKITPYELYQFMSGYHAIYPHERLGQAFVNKFLVDQQDPDLFYEEDRNKAEKIIATKYVNWES